MLKPKFTHDCVACSFHGRLDGKDVYTCDETVILRFGNHGPDYSSFSRDLIKMLPVGHEFRFALRLLA